MKKQPLTTKKMLGYCLGDIFGGGAFTLVGMLFVNYLTDEMGFVGEYAVVLTVMLLITKVWDAIIDPFIGSLSEKARSKVGRRRVFFLAGIFHIGASFLALWMPIHNVPMVVKIIYFTLAYMLFATSFSLTMVPYHAMLPELTDDLKLRNKTVSIRSIFSNCSSMIAGLIPSMLVGFLGYFGMGICFAIFYTIPWIFVFFSTKGIDLPCEEITKEEKVSKPNIFKEFIENGKVVLSNRSFRKLLGLYLLSYTAMDIFMAIIIYYVKWYMGIWQVKLLGFGAYVLLLGIFMIFEVLSIPIYTKLANKKGKRFAFLLGSGTWAAGTILLFLLANPCLTVDVSLNLTIILLFIPLAVMGFGAGAIAYIPWAMLPETMDVEELKSGERKDGVYSGFLTFIRQLVQAIGTGIIPLFLWLIGYHVDDLIVGVFADNGFISTSEAVLNGGVVLTSLDDLIKNLGRTEYLSVVGQIEPNVILGIKIFTTAAPCLLLLGSFLVSIFYPIDNKGYELLKNEIKNRNTTNKEDIAVLEKMIGSKYIKPNKGE